MCGPDLKIRSNLKKMIQYSKPTEKHKYHWIMYSSNPGGNPGLICEDYFEFNLDVIAKPSPAFIDLLFPVARNNQD